MTLLERALNRVGHTVPVLLHDRRDALISGEDFVEEVVDAATELRDADVGRLVGVVCPGLVRQEIGFVRKLAIWVGEVDGGGQGGGSENGGEFHLVSFVVFLSKD